jgi:hypothetical protein
MGAYGGRALVAGSRVRAAVVTRARRNNNLWDNRSPGAADGVLA